MPVMDVHTHMFTRRWLDLLRSHGKLYGVQLRSDGRAEIFRASTPVVPHQVHDVVGSLANTAALPPDRRDAIRGSNARRLFGL